MAKKEASADAPKKTIALSLGWTIGGLVALLAIGVAVYFFIQYQKTQALLKNPTASAQAQINTIIAKVGRLIELPTTEAPTLATVSDVSKLKDQTFFAHAQNGDKVLIYTKAKKAILYDPVADKIVEVGPVNINNQQQPAVAGASTAPSAPTPTQTPLNVAIYNGTKTTGLTTKAANQLKPVMSNVTVTDKLNAANDYPTTVVVDLSGKNMASAQQIAGVVKGDVKAMPAGEKKPAAADILVILGASYVTNTK